MDAIREDVSVLTLLAEILCLLDMIVNSFAHMISTKPVDRYIRPHLTGKYFNDSLSIFWPQNDYNIDAVPIMFTFREWTTGNWCWKTPFIRKRPQWFCCMSYFFIIINCFVCPVAYLYEDFHRKGIYFMHSGLMFFSQPNNIFLSEASNMVIVMGPNM